MLVSNLNPRSYECIYGEIGLAGKLGYDDLQVSVKLRHYTNTVSFHPPGRVTYILDDDYEHLTTLIGFNDTSFPGIKADFLIYADDILVSAACGVSSNEQPRELFVNINKAKKLEFVVETTTPQGCHPVWISPTLHREKMTLFPGVLGRAWGRIPDKIPVCEKCIFTTLTPNFVNMLDDMLGSLYLNGECRDASLFIFTLNADEKCKRLASKYNATIIPITVEQTNTLVLKSLVYSIASFVNADYYLMLDADMFILKSLKPVFDSIKTTNENNILVCREYNIPHEYTIRHLIKTNIPPYFGDENDDAFLHIGEEGESTFIVNGGVIAGSRRAWLSLDSTMRSYMPHSSAWDMQRPSVSWREQAIFNLALTKTQNYVELNSNLNVQMLHAKPEIQIQDKFILAFINRQLVSILHFNGVPGKEVYKHYAGKFSHIPDTKFGFDDIGSFKSFAQNLQSFAKVIKNKPKLRAIYADVENLSTHIHIYKYLFEKTVALKSPKIFEIGSRAGLMTNCLANACANNEGNILTIELDTPDEFNKNIETLPQNLQNIVTHKDEDSLVYLKKIQIEDRKFDIIICNTHNNVRNVCSQIVLANNMVAENGELYVMDCQYPMCDMDALNRRLNIANLCLEPLSDIKLKGLYLVKTHMETSE